MRRFTLLVLLIFLVVVSGAAQVDRAAAVSGEGWSISLDEGRHTLSILHETLGTVLTDVRLNLRGERGLNVLKNWSIETQGQKQLSIRTVKPASVWRFELGPTSLKISTTSADAVVTANAPAPAGRIVARLLDPQGVPVDWVGTHEIGAGYGASERGIHLFFPAAIRRLCIFSGTSIGLQPAQPLRPQDRYGDRFLSAHLDGAQPRDSNLLEITVPVPGNTLVRVIPDYFTNALGFPTTRPWMTLTSATAPMVWDSWESYYSNVREEDVVQQRGLDCRPPEALRYEFVALDDGYDRGKTGALLDRKVGQRKVPARTEMANRLHQVKGLNPASGLYPAPMRAPSSSIRTGICAPARSNTWAPSRSTRNGTWVSRMTGDSSSTMSLPRSIPPIPKFLISSRRSSPPWTTGVSSITNSTASMTS